MGAFFSVTWFVEAHLAVICWFSNCAILSVRVVVDGDCINPIDVIEHFRDFENIFPPTPIQNKRGSVRGKRVRNSNSSG